HSEPLQNAFSFLVRSLKPYKRLVIVAEPEIRVNQGGSLDVTCLAALALSRKRMSASSARYLAALWFDAQVAEKIAQEFALQRLVIFRDHHLPASQIVVYQNQFDQRTAEHHQRKSHRYLRVAVANLFPVLEKQLHQVLEGLHLPLSDLLIESRLVA